MKRVSSDFCTALMVLTLGVLTLSGCASQPKSINEVDQQETSATNTNNEPSTAEACDPNYEGGCIPLVNYDLDCPDINGPIYVVGTDIHRFDRDKNGVGCEPWP